MLDVGSGAGDVALLLADLVGPQGQVIGVDVNAEILQVARSRVQAVGWTTVTFHPGDIMELDLDRDFDAVAGRWVLPFLERVGAVRPDEVDIGTLEERLRAEVAGQDGIQLLPAIMGAWARI